MKKQKTYKKSRRKYLKNYSNHLKDLLADLDHSAVDKVIGCILKARERSSTIFFAGNGGSAATASHFAQDLGEVGRKIGAKCFKTMSLNDSVPFITALGNDYGYEHIFMGQLANHFRKGDVFIAISASGNSPNIVESVRWANKAGGITVGFVGFDGGKLGNLCRYVVHVATKKGEYGPVEDIHLIINHMITTYFMYSGLEGSKKKKEIR